MDISSPFYIGSVKIRNRLILAPLSGITDLPFRKLAWQYGAGLVVTEMIASRELVGNVKESKVRLMRDGDQPHVVQLAGRDPHWVAEAAKIAVDCGADIIDINMGCPAKKVTGGQSGSALMREPDLALSLVEATCKAVDIPVTVKMRLGWDDDTINAPWLANAAQNAGAQLITVHGRTRCQFYEGRADWQKIAEVNDVLSIPLVANGDVESLTDVQKIVKITGATAVMIGRGCLGRPWHIGDLQNEHLNFRKYTQDIDFTTNFIIKHYEMMLEHYGSLVGLRHARKHLNWYLERHYPDVCPKLRRSIMTSKEPKQVLTLLNDAFSEVELLKASVA